MLWLETGLLTVLGKSASNTKIMHPSKIVTTHVTKFFYYYYSNCSNWVRAWKHLNIKVLLLLLLVCQLRDKLFHENYFQLNTSDGSIFQHKIAVNFFYKFKAKVFYKYTTVMYKIILLDFSLFSQSCIIVFP